MSERKLARIVVVDDVVEHENADSLEIVVIGGWHCCTKKGEFLPGGLAVYCEVDSMLPLDNPHFEFLTGRNEREFEGKRYARIKTMKLRGELSQGIVFPLSILTGLDVVQQEDEDCTNVLGVVKYEPAVSVNLAGNAKGSFPVFIPKTDQTRVQNIKRMYDKAAALGEEFEVSYKLDGSSFTAFLRLTDPDDETSIETGVCSRNIWLDMGEANRDNMFVQTFNKYELDFKLGMMFKERGGLQLAIQGEMVGPGIQNNFEGVAETQLFVYNVFDIEKQTYLSPEIAQHLVNVMGLTYVPLFNPRTTLPKTLEECLEMADGPSALMGKYREGLVFKSLTRDFSFKVISNRYLLKEE
jgi:RNA ligase (TIGR02306 family)